MNRDFFFNGPDGAPHSFNVPHFVAGTVPPGGYVVCDCGHKHNVFQNKFEHGIRLGEIKPKDALYENHRTYRYYFSFVDEQVHEEFPGPTKL